MPRGTKHQSRKVTKLLNLGDSKSGKTGALIPLLEAGYRLVIADFDNGLDVISRILRDKPKVLDQMYYETFTDPLKMVGEQIVAETTPRAIVDCMKGLNRWKFPVEDGSDETYDLGGIGSWGNDTVFVLDSLGFAGLYALLWVRQLNRHQLDNFVSQPDWGQAMKIIEGMLQLLHADNIKCHVIVNTHITYLEGVVDGTIRGLPRALGSKLPPNVPGYFNSVVQTKTIGSGKNAKRVIRTASDGLLELALPIAPGTVPVELPVESGLLTIFKALQDGEWKPQS